MVLQVVDISDSDDDPKSNDRGHDVRSVAKRLEHVQIAATTTCNSTKPVKTTRKIPTSKPMFIDVVSPASTTGVHLKPEFAPTIINGNVRTGLPKLNPAAIHNTVRTETPRPMPNRKPAAQHGERHLETPRAQSKSRPAANEPGTSKLTEQDRVKNTISRKIADQIQRKQVLIDTTGDTSKERKCRFALADVTSGKRVPEKQDPPNLNELEARLSAPPLPLSVIDQVSVADLATNSRPWFASDSDNKFARFLINNSRDLSDHLCREVDGFADRFNTAYDFIHKNKTRTPKAIPQSARTENISINHRIVLSMAEVRLQLLKVFDAVMALVRSTDLSMPNVLRRLYDHNNVVSAHISFCR